MLCDLGKQVRAEAAAGALAGRGELSRKGRPGLGRMVSVAPEVCGSCPKEPGRLPRTNLNQFLERAGRGCASQEEKFPHQCAVSMAPVQPQLPEAAWPYPVWSCRIAQAFVFAAPEAFLLVMQRLAVGTCSHQSPRNWGFLAKRLRRVTALHGLATWSPERGP